MGLEKEVAHLRHQAKQDLENRKKDFSEQLQNYLWDQIVSNQRSYRKQIKTAAKNLNSE